MRLFTRAAKGLLPAAFVIALAAPVAAAPQGGHSGGGHTGGHAGGGHAGAGHAAVRGGRPQGHVARPGGHVHGSPGHRHGRGHVIVRGGFFYDPFWGPYDPWYGYGYPYGYDYDYPAAAIGDVRTEVKPKDTQVYVDGYFAGVADDFDGTFQRLHVAPGGHVITFYLDNYRTVTQNVYVRPDSTAKLKITMEKLAPGQTSEPVPEPTRPVGPTSGSTTAPDDGSAPQR
jgi:hypothetical protein